MKNMTDGRASFGGERGENPREGSLSVRQQRDFTRCCWTGLPWREGGERCSGEAVVVRSLLYVWQRWARLGDRVGLHERLWMFSLRLALAFALLLTC